MRQRKTGQVVCVGSENCAEYHCAHYYSHKNTGEFCETGLCPIVNRRVVCEFTFESSGKSRTGAER